jgi:hypothetical protein
LTKIRAITSNSKGVLTLRRFTTTSSLVILLLLAGPARADRVDVLCRSLTSDPSWRVRLQAAVVLGKLRDGRAVPSLLRALNDENETVRGLSAQVLGDLGDTSAIAALEQVHKRDASAFVREKTQQALSKLRPDAFAGRGAAPRGEHKWHVEVGGIGAKSHQVSPEMTRQLRQFIIRELERAPNVALNDKQANGFLIDSSITSVSRRLTDEWVEISCEVSFVVGRLPSKAMVMMTSGGATVQAPRAGFRPEKERALQIDALEGAVQGANQNLLAFLKTQQPM